MKNWPSIRRVSPWRSLADLLEVMRAVVKARGWTIEQLEQIRTEKAIKRGGFEEKILLKGVQE